MKAARRAGVATDSLLRQLGLTLASHGRAAEALEILAPLAEAADPRSVNAYALALSEAGQQAAAKAELDRVLALDPGNPMALEELSMVQLRQRHWDAARSAAEQAVELNPGLFRAWNNLGVALYQSGRWQPALDAWQRAVDLQPDLFDALYNLGVKALEHQRLKQAREALEAFVGNAPAADYAADLRRARVLLGRIERRLDSP
jgi:tetratricopeptide (TPR) repeat protein